jgi:uncharacterized protein YkwD
VLLTAPAPPAPPRPPTRRARRLLAAIGAVVTVVGIAPVLVLAAAPASASSDPANTLVAATNQARAAAGVGALSVSGDLSAAATRQAQDMAASGVLYHTPNLSSAVCCWVVLGENVGEGPSAARLHAAFMASPEHRANILRSSFTQIGVGYAIDHRGTLWVSEMFRRPSGTVTVVKPVAVVRPVVTSTPRAVTKQVSKSSVKAAVPALRPPVAAVAAAPPVAEPAGPVSRDLARLPLAAAQRFAAQIGGAVTGTNPVSRLLDFAAVASSTN